MSSKHDEPLPREWEVVRVGDICNQRNEIVQPSGKGKYRFVGLEHVNSGETRIHNHDSDVNVKSSKFRFYAGDILYGKLRPYLDKAALTGFEGICSTDLLVLTAQNKKTLAEFLVYVIHSNKFVRHAISTTSGTNHPRTSWKAISKFKFGLPPCPEQRRIAEILTTADTAIQKVDDAIAKTERLKRGLMQELLTKGIGHEEFKDSDVGRIPRGWGVVRVGDICNQRNEIVQPSGKGKYRFVGLEHVNSGETRIHNHDSDVNVKSSKFRFYIEDLLYGKLRPYLDKAVLTGSEGICSTDLLVLTAQNEKTLAEFLVYVIHSKEFIRHAISTTSGTNHPRTSWKAISKFKFGLPPLSEQRRIAEILSTVDKKLELERKRKEKLERIKKGLMNELLTGKKRVTIAR